LLLLLLRVKALRTADLSFRQRLGLRAEARLELLATAVGGACMDSSTQ